MAKAEELDLDTKKDSGGGGKKGKLKLILLIVGILLLVTGGVLGALYFTGKLGGGDKAEHGDKSAKSDHKSDKQAADLPLPANYLDVKPVLVSNFEDQSAGATYLQIDMQLMARDPHVLDVAKLHMPVIRNNLLLIMSSQKVADMKTRAGKEKLQQTMLAAVQKIISDSAGQHGETKEDAAKSRDNKDKHDEKSKDHEKSKDNGHAQAANVDAVYFTSFIMQ